MTGRTLTVASRRILAIGAGAGSVYGMGKFGVSALQARSVGEALFYGMVLCSLLMLLITLMSGKYTQLRRAAWRAAIALLSILWLWIIWDLVGVFILHR